MTFLVMMLLSALRLLGCAGQATRSWHIPHGELRPQPVHSNLACANLSFGEEVVDRFRGKGHFVCHNQDNSGLIGICQAPFSGHDNYYFCKGHLRRPSFCGLRSLWWVRCATIQFPATTQMPVSTTFRHTTYPRFPPFTSRPGTTVPFPSSMPHTGQCGCSWSSQHGCVVSSKQMLSSFAKGCRSSSSQECFDRRNLVAKAEPFMKCPSYSAVQCFRDSMYCRWAAQGSGECGVNEEQLVLHLVGIENRNHPLVELILRSSHCHRHAESTCEAEKECTWVPHHPQAVCDIRPSLVVEMMFRHPDLVMTLQRSGEEAFCRMHTGTGSCPSHACHISGDVCQLSREKATATALEHMMSTVCKRSFTTRSCPAPCRLVRSHTGVQECLMQPQGFVGHDPLMRDSEHIIRVMSMLISATARTQLSCVEGNSRPDLCEARACDEEAPLPPMVEGALPSPSALGPGLKGVLQQVSTAIAAGEVEQFLGDHLDNNPDAALQNLTKLALDNVYAFFKPQPTPPAPSVDQLPPVAEEAVPAVPEYSESGEGFEIEDEDEGPELLTPWVIAGAAVLLAAVCSGVALGLLCHARRFGGQAREPLLAGSAMDGEAPSVAVAATEQEMEPANAGNS